MGASLPALADDVAVDIHDEGTLLVGDPSGRADVYVDQRVLAQGLEAGTAKAYAFQIEPEDNRLAIDLVYDAGQVSSLGPCLKANDLDLHVEGPGFERVYDGCDGGEITLLRSTVPTGSYTVRVAATQGSTLCVPEVGSACSPGVHYRIEIKVWDTAA